MKVKTYDLVGQILEEYVDCRNSDKKLLWEFWKRSGLISLDGSIHYQTFLYATSSESITRARRKVQEKYPELGSNKGVQKEKDKKESTKGTFIYSEIVMRREI